MRRQAVVELRSAKANEGEVVPTCRKVDEVNREHSMELVRLASLSSQESPRTGKQPAPKDLDLDKDLLTEKRTLEPGFQGG